MTDEHEHVSEKLYLTIAGSLAILTIVSYVADLIGLSGAVLILVILGVAVVKASLVALFFMHLSIDWKKVRVLIIPAVVLAAVLIFALLPDMVFSRRDQPSDAYLDASLAAPLEAAKAHEPGE